MANPFITQSNKQQLVDWYYQEIAAQLGRDCEIHLPTGETERPEINGPEVKKTLVYRSKV